MDDSPLGRLAPELRNKIYELTFTNSQVHLDKLDEGVGSLLHTCREIRHEARILMFASADIRIHGCTLAVRQTKEAIGTLILDVFGAQALLAIPSRLIWITTRSNFLIFVLRFNCSRCFPGAQCKALESQNPGGIEGQSGWVHSEGEHYCDDWLNFIFGKPSEGW